MSVVGLYSSALDRVPLIAVTAGDEDLAVGQQRRRVEVACGVQAAGGGPGVGRRVVQLRAGQIAAVAVAAGDEDLAVVQQRRRVIEACGVQAAGGGPGVGRRVVQLRAGQSAAVALAAGDEDLAVVQQRRRVIVACGVQAAGGGPGAGGRVVQLRAGQQRCCRLDRRRRGPGRCSTASPWHMSRAVIKLPVAVQVLVVGLYSSALDRVPLKWLPPPATRTWPLFSSVAVAYSRAACKLPVADQAPAAGARRASSSSTASRAAGFLRRIVPCFREANQERINLRVEWMGPIMTITPLSAGRRLGCEDRVRGGIDRIKRTVSTAKQVAMSIEASRRRQTSHEREKLFVGDRPHPPPGFRPRERSAASSPGEKRLTACRSGKHLL